MDKDLYEILGIKKQATDDEIRKSFRKLAKKYHPDVNANNKEAERRFKEANLAHEVLKDPKKRAQYDQMRAAGANPFASQSQAGAWRTATGSAYGPEGVGDMGLGDLFQEIFGGNFGSRSAGRGGFGTRRSPFQEPGQSRDASFTISFMDAAKGAEKVVDIGGKRLTIKIPEGVDSGSKIKLSGQGDPGQGRAPAGDLIITLEVEPHPYFIREGSNLVLKLPITIPESILGGDVEIPTLDGKVHLKIPKGISSGQRLKLSEKGIRSAKSGKRGDQFVEILIKVPKQPDANYLEAVEKMQKTSFNPRQGLF